MLCMLVSQLKDMYSVADPGIMKGGGGAVHPSRGVWGHAPPPPPPPIFEFRSYEVVSGAFYVENCFLRLHMYVHAN